MDTRSDAVRAVILAFERRLQLRAVLLTAAVVAAAFFLYRRAAPVPAPAPRR